MPTPTRRGLLCAAAPIVLGLAAAATLPGAALSATPAAAPADAELFALLARWHAADEAHRLACDESSRLLDVANALCPPRPPTLGSYTRDPALIAIHNAYQAEERRISAATGFTAAEAAEDAACAACSALEEPLLAHPARTLPGLRAKAAWVARLAPDGAFGDDDFAAFAAEVAAFDPAPDGSGGAA